MYNARRLNVPLEKFPKLVAAEVACLKLPPSTGRGPKTSRTPSDRCELLLLPRNGKFVTTTHLGRVVFWMTGALFSFSISAIAIRALARHGLNVFEILSVRSGCGLAVLLALVLVRRELRAEIVPRRMGMHLARNSTHFVGQYLWALAVTLLPLATVFALEFTTPMWVAILAVPLLGERLSRPHRQRRSASSARGDCSAGPREAFQPALIVLLAAVAFLDLADRDKEADCARIDICNRKFWMNAMQFPMVRGQRSVIPIAARLGRVAAIRRPRGCRPDLALLPDQTIPAPAMPR